MRNRDISLIVIGLFIGAVIGGVIGNLLAWSLPEGVVKDFFLTSLTFHIGSNIGENPGVVMIDLGIIIFKFGLAVDFICASNYSLQSVMVSE